MEQRPNRFPTARGEGAGSDTLRGAIPPIEAIFVSQRRRDSRVLARTEKARTENKRKRAQRRVAATGPPESRGDGTAVEDVRRTREGSEDRVPRDSVAHAARRAGRDGRQRGVANCPTAERNGPRVRFAPLMVDPMNGTEPSRMSRLGTFALALGLALLPAWVADVGRSATRFGVPGGTAMRNAAVLLGQEGNAEGNAIRKIEIRGLTRTPESELLSRLSGRVRIGEPYSREAVDEETRRLFNLGQFLRIRRPIVEEFEDGVKIIFVVEEKPFVRSVRFPGRQQLSRDYLLKGDTPLLTRENDLYNPYWVQQDEQGLREKYRDKGYFFAEIRSEVQMTEGGIEVTFTIREGSRVLIRSVEFVGNRSIDSSELLRIMSTREKDFWFFGLRHSGYYDSDELQRDILNLKMYYRQFGFFDVWVEPESIELSPDKTELHVRIRIEEGPVYLFRGYRFTGNAVFSDTTLRKLSTARIGSPFDRESLNRDIAEIKKYYGDRAYVFARIEPELEYSEDKAEVHVRLDVREDNEIYIHHVRVQGNLKTQDRVIRRELEFYPGERVDQRDLVKSRSNLARLGIFRDITYDYEGTGEFRDVVVNVDEDTSGQLIVGFGVTSGFGIIGNLTITKRNFDITDWPDSIYGIQDRFTGAGQTLHVVMQPGTRRSLYRLTFIEPYIFDTRNELSLSASSLDLIREDWDEDRATAAPTISHSFDFDRDFRVSLGMRFENVEVKDIEPTAPQAVLDSAGHSAVVALNTGLSYNKALFEPYEGPYDGHQEVIYYEYAGGFLGGDVDFHKVEVTNDFFFPLYVHEENNLHHVISLQNRFGLIEPHTSRDFIPIFERYFLGGPQTVRGFRFRGLGPHENGTPFGGTAQLWGNIEYTFPIFQKVLRGVVFFDYGNLAPSLDDFDFSQMRYAAGGGVRLMFPFLGGQPLPIGLFFGVPLHKEDGDRSRLFLFTIGTPF